MSDTPIEYAQIDYVSFELDKNPDDQVDPGDVELFVRLENQAIAISGDPRTIAGRLERVVHWLRATSQGKA